MITIRDDDWIRTHDEAAQLLRYAIPGARVEVEPIREAREGDNDTRQAARRFRITVERIGREPMSTADIYALPCLGEPLARRARELADHAAKA